MLELVIGLGLLGVCALAGYVYGIRVGHAAGVQAGFAAGENSATGRLLENGMIDGPVPYMGHVL